MKIRSYMLGLLLVMSWPLLSHADPMKLNLQPDGIGRFILTGENVVGVQALDVEIDYDPSLLESPYLLISGGELKQTTADTPGKLLVSIFRQVPDAFLQIVLKFESKTDTPGGGIQHISIAAITRSTAKRPPDPADATSPPANADDTKPADGAVASSSQTTVGETAAGGPVNTEVAPGGSKGATWPFSLTAASPEGSDKKILPEEITALVREEKNVLQRFKKFRGEKGLNSLAALFGRSDEDRFVQEPAIAISDGKTPVLIRMEVRPDSSQPVTVALADAKLISKEAVEKGIVITVLPSEGTRDAGVVVVTGREILDCPIVVAPPVDLSGSINANNFFEALQAYIGRQAAALQTENKVYIPEYIFTANYLAALNRRPR